MKAGIKVSGRDHKCRTQSPNKHLPGQAAPGSSSTLRFPPSPLGKIIYLPSSVPGDWNSNQRPLLGLILSHFLTEGCGCCSLMNSRAGVRTETVGKRSGPCTLGLAVQCRSQGTAGQEVAPKARQAVSAL